MEAIIDLGTNTIHLLIFQLKENFDFEVIYRESSFVRIGKNGNQPIPEEDVNRAIDTLIIYKRKIDEFPVNSIQLFGTEAIRSASNQNQIVSLIKLKVGLDLKILSGEEEADLIFKGTQLALNQPEGNYMIMDIGGGSVEFIFCKDDKLLKSESKPLGVQFLKNKFNVSDPIQAVEIDAINAYIEHEIGHFFQENNSGDIGFLVGSSESYEVMLDLLDIAYADHKITIIDAGRFDDIFNLIIRSTIEERLKMKALNPNRVELILFGFIIIRYALNHLNPKYIYVSEYALKEGLIFEAYQDFKCV